jgi:hypothetical protein
MSIVNRVKAILLAPKSEWTVIEAEADDVPGIYKKYLIYLAAIPALAMFIGLSLIGVGGFGISVKLPFFAGLINAIVSYVLSLVMLYVMSLIVDALAPTFGGQKKPLNAFKVIAYGSTAAMVAGVFHMIPGGSILALLGSLYSIYLIYLGLPLLMKCPQEKAVAYTALVIVCAIVAGLLISAISSIFVPGPGSMNLGDSGTLSISTRA